MARRLTSVKVLLATSVVLALSACIPISSISAAGGHVFESNGSVQNSNFDLFHCVGSSLDSLAARGGCAARYEGTGIRVQLPTACISVMETFYAPGIDPGPGDIGPIDVQVLEDGTDQVLAEVPDVGAAPWTTYNRRGFNGYLRSSRGVVFTTSGPGTISLPPPPLFQGLGHVSFDTPRLVGQSTYVVKVTCATSWDRVSGAVTRKTETVTYTPT